MTTHKFHCTHCRFKFSFESEESDVQKFVKSLKKGVQCPQCDRTRGEKGVNIEHDFVPPRSKRTLESLRKENKERSAQAKAQAAQYASENPQPRMANLQRPSNMGAPTQEGRAVEAVPENVIESLKEKAIPKDEE